MLSRKDFLFDKRLLDRFITRGDITRQNYEAHLASLPDVKDKSEPLSLVDSRENPAESGEQGSSE
jgi:hypothetical protein